MPGINGDYGKGLNGKYNLPTNGNGVEKNSVAPEKPIDIKTTYKNELPDLDLGNDPAGFYGAMGLKLSAYAGYPKDFAAAFDEKTWAMVRGTAPEVSARIDKDFKFGFNAIQNSNELA